MPGELLTEKPASEAEAEASGGEEMAADSAGQKSVAAKKSEAPASKAVVGIIYPPPEVRSIPTSALVTIYIMLKSFANEFYLTFSK